MRAEQFAFHHLGKANDCVERGAQFMAHCGKETAFRAVCRLRPVLGMIALRLGLLELGDEFVLLGLKGEGLERFYVAFWLPA